MITKTQGDAPFSAYAFVMASAVCWWLFDTGGLQTLARANAPTWDRSVPGVELPVYNSEAITTLASGSVAIARCLAKTG